MAAADDDNSRKQDGAQRASNSVPENSQARTDPCLSKRLVSSTDKTTEEDTSSPSCATEQSDDPARELPTNHGIVATTNTKSSGASADDFANAESVQNVAKTQGVAAEETSKANHRGDQECEAGRAGLHSLLETVPVGIARAEGGRTPHASEEVGSGKQDDRGVQSTSSSIDQMEARTLTKLVTLGFPQEMCRDALQAANKSDVEAAVRVLMDEMGEQARKRKTKECAPEQRARDDSSQREDDRSEKRRRDAEEDAHDALPEHDLLLALARAGPPPSSISAKSPAGTLRPVLVHAPNGDAGSTTFVAAQSLYNVGQLVQPPVPLRNLGSKPIQSNLYSGFNRLGAPPWLGSGAAGSKPPCPIPAQLVPQYMLYENGKARQKGRPPKRQRQGTDVGQDLAGGEVDLGPDPELALLHFPRNPRLQTVRRLPPSRPGRKAARSGYDSWTYCPPDDAGKRLCHVFLKRMRRAGLLESDPNGAHCSSPHLFLEKRGEDHVHLHPPPTLSRGCSEDSEGLQEFEMEDSEEAHFEAAAAQTRRRAPEWPGANLESGSGAEDDASDGSADCCNVVVKEEEEEEERQEEVVGPERQEEVVGPEREEERQEGRQEEEAQTEEEEAGEHEGVDVDGSSDNEGDFVVEEEACSDGSGIEELDVEELSPVKRRRCRTR